jgi:hypothetical protein
MILVIRWPPDQPLASREKSGANFSQKYRYLPAGLSGASESHASVHWLRSTSDQVKCRFAEAGRLAALLSGKAGLLADRVIREFRGRGSDAR